MKQVNHTFSLKINCILYQVVRLWASQLILNRFKTRLISPIGKLRAGLDLVIPPIKIEDDISVGAFLEDD